MNTKGRARTGARGFERAAIVFLLLASCAPDEDEDGADADSSMMGDSSADGGELTDSSIMGDSSADGGELTDSSGDAGSSTDTASADDPPAGEEMPVDVIAPRDSAGADDPAADTRGAEDVASDVGERDHAVVAAALERLSISAYEAGVRAAADPTASCFAEQPSAGTEPECVTDGDCGDDEVCRNVRQRGRDSTCECLAGGACDDATGCEAGSVCLGGVHNSGRLCGGGLGTVLCVNECVAGPCWVDSDCDVGSVCVLVLDQCENIGGTACTPAAGIGCLGVVGGCRSDDVCEIQDDGRWTCVGRALGCD